MSSAVTEIYGPLSQALLADKMVSDQDGLAAYRTDHPFAVGAGSPVLAVRPQNVTELQAVVRLANQRGLALVPVSSGPRHGKGGVSCERDFVAVDLSGWKKIDLVDRRNRVCRIEPGVTYGELTAELGRHGMTVSMPLAPRAGKSVVAAVMDREPSTWPNRQWDIGDPVASTEIVFGTGDLFRTGGAGGPGTIEAQRAAGGAQKGPMGPSQTDFQRVVAGAQGAMGIVTWITVRAEILPTVQEPRLLGADDLGRLLSFVYEVQRPWIGEHSLILDRAAAAMLIAAADGADYQNLKNSLPGYICLQNIAGFERLPAERVAYQLKDIETMAQRNGLTLSKSLGLMSAAKLLETATAPGGETDWRNRLRGACLSIFFLTTLDRAPAYIIQMKKLLERVDLAASEIGAYIQPVVQNHACHLEFMVPYDPASPAVVERLQTFEAVAVRELIAAGAFFSRPYGSAERAAFESNPVNTDVLRKIKAIFDPGHVLAPGKFGL